MGVIRTKSDFSGMLPAIDVEILQHDPRRSEVRQGAPWVMRELDEKGQSRELRFEIELERCVGRSAAPAVVMDCTTGGLCVISKAFIQPAEVVDIVASDALSKEVLFRQLYQVCGRRRANASAMPAEGAGSVTEQGTAMRAAGYGGDSLRPEIPVPPPEYRYSLRLVDRGGHSRVFKSYLFGLLHEFLQDQPDVDLQRLLRQAAGLDAQDVGLPQGQRAAQQGGPGNRMRPPDAAR